MKFMITRRFNYVFLTGFTTDATRLDHLVMKRVEWDTFYMRQAYQWACQSTCAKHKTGCVIVREGRVVCSGFNGAPSGMMHCEDYWSQQEDAKNEDFYQSEDFKKSHRQWSLTHEMHGETNALLFASKHGIKLKDSIMYSYMEPCERCALSIKSAGISKVFFTKDHHGTGKILLEKLGVTCEKLAYKATD